MNSALNGEKLKELGRNLGIRYVCIAPDLLDSIPSKVKICREWNLYLGCCWVFVKRHISINRLFHEFVSVADLCRLQVDYFVD